MLKINNLVSGYGTVQILNGASMKVEKQSIVALLGGNGTGKSTILKACSGIIRSWKGNINLEHIYMIIWIDFVMLYFAVIEGLAKRLCVLIISLKVR